MQFERQESAAVEKVVPADETSAASNMQELGTSRWQLADNLNVRAGSVQR